MMKHPRGTRQSCWPRIKCGWPNGQSTDGGSKPRSAIFDGFLAPALITSDEVAEMERMSARAAAFLDPDAAGLAPAEALARMMRFGSHVRIR